MSGAIQVFGRDPFAVAGYENIVGMSPDWNQILGANPAAMQHAQALAHAQQLAAAQRFAATQPVMHAVPPREQRGFDLFNSQVVSSTTGATMTLTPYTFFRGRKLVGGDDAATAGLYYSFITGIFIGNKVQGANTVGTVPVGFYAVTALGNELKLDTAQPTIPILINLTSPGASGGRTVYIKITGDVVQ